ncbi:MAG: Stk1 family PASTA domain-containing Ser/Thr kinase [Halanaerobiales bacterium]
MLGKVLNNRYKIIREIGMGGMAIVYEAQDLLLDRKVAIKKLRSEYVSDSDFTKKFRQEAKAVARISHTNVVSIFDIGQDNDQHYLVMEYIEGSNLKDIINKRGKLTIAESLDIASQICSALMVAHKNKIIHCDIKPHNIIINSEKQVKVTDFGIARAVTTSTLTITDTIMGSAHYFSPEQAKGGEINAYSDIYSVGIVLYEMLTGQVPFTGKSPISVALKHIQEKPKKPSELNTSIPESVEELVIKALHKEPEKRFKSASSMKQTITQVMKGLKDGKKGQKTTVVSDEEDTKIIKKSDIIKKQKQEQQYKVHEDNKIDETKDSAKNNLKSKVNISGKKKWLLWIGVIFTVMFISILGMIYFYQNYTDVPTVEVPDIVGMELEKAESRAALVGLELRVETRVNHATIPENNIISQIPEGGEMVKQTRLIMATLSKGPVIISMPDLKGLDLRKARVMLDNKGIQIGNIDYTYDRDIPVDTIIGQEPEPDVEIKGNENINLVVSQGPPPEMISVPNLIGLEKEEAVNLLQENGLRVGEITSQKTRRYLENQISDQEYQPEADVPKNTDVNLTVSEGLINTENATVHSVTAKFTYSELRPGRVKMVVIDNNGEETVYNQIHEPGDFIQVKINSVGPTTYKTYIDGELFDKDTLE